MDRGNVIFYNSAKNPNNYTQLLKLAAKTGN